MHELSLMEGLVATVLEEVGEARVTRVSLAVGRLSCVVPEALRFCFDVCTADTTLAGATLEVRVVEGRARCRRCGEERAIGLDFAPCPCGSVDRDVIAGQELSLQEVEVMDVPDLRL